MNAEAYRLIARERAAEVIKVRDELGHARAEIERLRKALTRIRDHYDDTDLAAKHMAAIACAALSEPQADSAVPETAGRNGSRSGDGQSDKAVMCKECGKYPADLPSRLCPGCEAYREHTAIY